jgi:microsomal dipeptidase-like Zn-dependent dipeptidase
MKSWADLPALTAELLRRGYTEGDLGKIYHGNFSRVMGSVLGP